MKSITERIRETDNGTHCHRSIKLTLELVRQDLLAEVERLEKILTKKRKLHTDSINERVKDRLENEMVYIVGQIDKLKEICG